MKSIVSSITFKRIFSVILCVIMVLSLAACGGNDAKKSAEAAADPNAPKRTKITAATSSFETLAPYNAVAGAGYVFLNHVYEGLVAIEETGTEPTGCLAKNFEKTAPYTWNVELYDYITDSAGNKITTDDVIFSYKTAQEAGVKAASYVAEINKVDDYNFEMVFTIDYPSCWSLANLKIVSKKAFEESSNALADTAVGTGPYVITSFTSGANVTLEKRDNYWQTEELTVANSRASVDIIQYDVIQESAQVQMALTSGAIQFGSVDKEIADSLANVEGLTVHSFPATQVRGIAFNMHNGICADNLKLRQAICYAIDKEAIVTLCTGDAGEASKAVGASFASAWDPRFETEDYYDYNPEKAKELLAEAGYPNGVTVRALTLAWPDFQSHVQVIQACLMAVGINVEIHEYDDTTYKAYKNAVDGEYDFMLVYMDTSGYNPRSVKQYIDKTGYSDGYNMIGMNDDELQRLYENAMMNEQDGEAFYELNAYIKEKCCLFGTHTTVNYVVTVDKILEPFIENGSYPRVGPSIISDDYDIYG